MKIILEANEINAVRELVMLLARARPLGGLNPVQERMAIELAYSIGLALFPHDTLAISD